MTKVLLLISIFFTMEALASECKLDDERQRFGVEVNEASSDLRSLNMSCSLTPEAEQNDGLKAFCAKDDPGKLAELQAKMGELQEIIKDVGDETSCEDLRSVNDQIVGLTQRNKEHYGLL